MLNTRTLLFWKNILIFDDVSLLHCIERVRNHQNWFLKTHSFYTFKEPKIGTSLILCGLQWTVINGLLRSRGYLAGHIVLFLTGFPICICTFDQSTITSLNQQIFCETHQSKLHWNPNLFLFWWPCSHQQFNRASVHFSHSTSYSRPYGIESDKREIHSC